MQVFLPVFCRYRVFQLSKSSCGSHAELRVNLFWSCFIMAINVYALDPDYPRPYNESTSSSINSLVLVLVGPASSCAVSPSMTTAVRVSR